jgi:quinol monooxygenase YgiN
MIHVIATIDIADGQRDRYLAEARKLVPLVRAEKGCIDYGPAIDLATGIPAQVSLGDNVVVMVERWESLDALRAHLQAPHMADYRARVKDLVRGVKLQVLQPA